VHRPVEVDPDDLAAEPGLFHGRQIFRRIVLELFEENAVAVILPSA